MRALLVCSSGGHLIQLHNLKPWWERHDRLWVTFEKLDSTSLLAGEQVAWAYHPTTRNLPNLLRNTRLAWKLLRALPARRGRLHRRRGRLPVLPAGQAVRHADRVRRGLRPDRLADHDRPALLPVQPTCSCVQWEEQRRSYPKGTVIGSLL